MLDTANSRMFESRFTRAIPLESAERSALSDLPFSVVTLAADQDIVREGDRPSRCAYLIDGFAATCKTSASGKRQVAAFHIQGDMPDLMSLHLELMDSDLRTLTRCEVGFIDHRAIRDLCDHHSRLAALLWKTTLVDASIFREWVVNVGQRHAAERMAHLFCEMKVRMDSIGKSVGMTCLLPLTQSDLSEALSLSIVHVNRTLQELRSRRLISFASGMLTIHDWESLAELADFRPDYLHLPAAPPAGRPI